MNGFCEMGGADLWGAGQIGDGASHLENAVVGPGRESQFHHGGSQQVFGFFLQWAVSANLCRSHLGVAEDGNPRKALRLNGARLDNPLSDDPGGLSCRVASQLLVLDLRDVQVQIDSVQQRSRDPGEIPLDLRRSADALLHCRAPVTAGAGVHGCYQHESGGEGQRAGGPTNGHLSLF